MNKKIDLNKNINLSLNMDFIQSFMNTAFYILIGGVTLLAVLTSSALYDFQDGPWYTLLQNILLAFVPMAAVVRIALIWIKLLLKKEKEQTSSLVPKQHWILLSADLLALILVFVYWYVRGRWYGEYILYLTLLCAVGSVELSFKKIGKIWLSIECIGLIVLFLLAFFGVISNNRGNSWGYIYRTDYAAILLYVFLFYCFIHRKNMSLTGKICLAALFAFNVFFVGGKTSIACMFLAFTGMLLRTERVSCKLKFLQGPRLRKAIKILAAGSFLLLAALMVGFCLAVAFLPQSVLDVLNKIPKFGSIVSRLNLSEIGFRLFKIRLFGNTIIQQGNGGLEGSVSFYYFLDSSYIKLLLQHGLLLFGLILGLMTVGQLRLHRRNYLYGMLLMSIVALDCLIEHHMVDLAYNVFLLLPFAKIDIAEEKTETSEIFRSLHILQEKCETAIIACWRQGTTGKRKVLIPAIVLVLLFNACTYSAKTITRWDDSAPQYDATVIIPVNQLPGGYSAGLLKNQGNSSYLYLQMHKDADCIISASEEYSAQAEACRDYLIGLGVDASRLFLRIGTENLTEVLTDAQNAIESENLPARKTVCAPALMQTEIEELAKDLGMTTNGLRARMPASGWLPMFVRAQVSYLGREFRQLPAKLAEMTK